MIFKILRFSGVALAVGLASPLFAQTPTATPLTIDQTDTAIRVDGHLEDWPAARMLVFNQASQIVSGKIFWKGPDFFQGRVFLTYDADYLYIGAVVQKDGDVVNSNEGPSIWNGDCVELFLSTQPYSSSRHQTSHGDYHLGFSPGTGCKSPQIYCFNKNKDVPGGRLIARKANKGYVMEACVPLTFFEGLEIGPGKLNAFNAVLDMGGSLSGNRTVQMDLNGHVGSGEDPSRWTEIQWTGSEKVSVPETETSDLYASLVKDGVKGATFLGARPFQGQVLDGHGKPIAGAKVTTWPKTKAVVTDAQGRFQFDKIKVYDSTLFYGRKEGFVTSLAVLPPKGAPVALTLQAVLPGFRFGEETVSPIFFGQTIHVPATGKLSDSLVGIQDRVKALHLNVLKLAGTEKMLQGDLEAQSQALDQFVAFARAAGAEPVIELPISREDPESVAKWVTYCNVQKKYGIRYWVIGEEPDLYGAQADKTFDGYNAYDYINDFRSIYNAAKKVDPSITIWGPELAWKYQDGNEDWVSPLLKYDGDIVDGVSVHHYASLEPGQCSVSIIQKDLRQVNTLLQGLRDKISTNTDAYTPLLFTGGSTCPEPVTSKGVSQAGPDSFWSAFWEAQWIGELMRNHTGTAVFSCLKGMGDMDLLAGDQPKPAYWPLAMIGGAMKGKVIGVQSQQSGILAYATQDPQSRDVTILLISQNDRYCRPKMWLNGKDGDIVVDAGLNQRFDYEIPSNSISVLKIKADKSHDVAVLYTQKMTLAGKEPVTSEIKPW